ncbi:MAG: TIGR03986 family CRISPR-associated RAMP protein [Limnochordia bacterium]|nr:TIGR03986 family CRISPR-associated RAMP protein [Limnochordia bacterium]
MSKNRFQHVGSVAKERAGRAPYNFVPPPEEVFTLDGKAVPDMDGYHDQLFTGWIDYRIECLTDTYIRGMWPLQENRAGVQTEPFSVGKEPVIPGSSLRGMIRTLLEVLSAAPLRQMHDGQLFMRVVGSNPNHQSKSYEPTAKLYAEQMADEKVKAGYLYVEGKRWFIRPATPINDDLDAGYAQYRCSEQWKRKEGFFRVEGKCVTKFTERREEDCTHRGWLVCSGSMQKKKRQWVINEEDPQAEEIEIPRGDVDAYLESGYTPILEKNKDFIFGQKGRGTPCFFVEWDANGEKHVSFGHTRYFRFPYEKRTVDANPYYGVYDDKVDFVQALFGRTASRGKDGAELAVWQGRVFFEDAFLVEPAEKGAYRDKAVRLKILSQPKPTTYQHYLTQSSDKVTQVKHWDSEDATIRGFKFYWHRPGADYVCRSREHQGETEHHTYVQPVLRGNVFKGRIRFENLTPDELGGLLTVLDLPEGCAHKIGMGKPLGLGSIRVKDIKVYRTVRQERYTWLFDSTGNLDTGVIPVENTQMLQDRFAERVNPEVKTVEELWQTERLHELHCMLKFDGLPKDWNHRTRYLFFGRINGKNYNEYIENNVPNGEGYEKRRVLPKPSTVLKGNVPNDRMPPFEGTCK